MLVSAMYNVVSSLCTIDKDYQIEYIPQSFHNKMFYETSLAPSFLTQFLPNLSLPQSLFTLEPVPKSVTDTVISQIIDTTLACTDRIPVYYIQLYPEFFQINPFLSFQFITREQ